MTLIESPNRHEVEPVYKPIFLVTLGFKGAGTTSWHFALMHYLKNSFLVKNSSFAFDITGANGEYISDPTDTSPLPPQPTSTIESHTYRLQCQPKVGVIPKPSPLAVWDSPEKRMARNVRWYSLKIHHIPAIKTQGLFTGGQIDPDIESLMTNADRVLYFISPMPPIGMDDSNHDTAQAKALNTLRKSIKKPQGLCVCLTNTDRINVPIKTTRNLYSLGKVAEVIEKYNLPFFPMTNVGYQPKNYSDRTRQSNYDHATGGVLFGGTDWRPVGVARPLFQLFSSLERVDRSLTQLQYPE